MNDRPVRAAALAVVAGLLLAGCAADPASPDAGGPPTPAVSTSAEADGQGPYDEPSPDREDGSTSAEATDLTAPTSDDGSDTGSDTGSGGGLEMPQAPEPSLSSLSELIGPSSTSPLVTVPLPRAASARGRLLARFPTVLRPTRAARVQSSSLSPSGDRLRVGLVASTTLSPEEVLLAYRTRLARHGLVELTTPPTFVGSQAAAFRGDGSVVTVTATPDGSRTSYSVHATLRPGRR